MESFLLFFPEAITLLSALAVFACIIFRASAETTWRIAVIGSVLTFGAALTTLGHSGEPFFPGIYQVDLFSQVLKAALAATLLLVLLLGSKPLTLRQDAWREFPLFLFLSTAGMMMLVSAKELLTLYVALELSAFPVYALIALHRSRAIGSEGAAKYMLQGMVASAATLYGMSFLFGLTGSTYLTYIAAAAPAASAQPLFVVGILLTLTGFLFKLALFPFHFWAPDAYQAGPHPVVAFLATASKAATIAVLCRVVGLLMEDGALPAFGEGLRFVLICFSVAAMTIGNLAALVQKDVKRLLGYSAVAHAGYIVIGLQAFSDLGLAAVLFYLLGYLAMSYLCFLVVCEVGRDRDLLTIESMAGLWQRSPFLTICLFIGLFGLTGLPPTVGFIGKWFLFSAALEGGQFWLVLIAAANSAVAIYYYLQILRVAFLSDPTESTLRPAAVTVCAGALACIAVIWMGSAPNGAWELARGAAALISG